MNMFLERSCECYHCVEKEEVMKYAAEFYQAILDQLYGEDFDEDKCEWLLDELGGYLGVKIPEGDLNIESKRG